MHPFRLYDTAVVCVETYQHGYWSKLNILYTLMRINFELWYMYKFYHDIKVVFVAIGYSFFVGPMDHQYLFMVNLQ